MMSDAARPRIVSMLASATEIVAALGLDAHLVAISHECDYPPSLLDRPRASRPRFDPTGLTSGAIDRELRRVMAEHGSAYEIDGALLESLEPDLILTQAVCEVCAVPTPGVRDVVRERGLGARVLSLDAHTLEEILAAILDVGAAAEAAGAVGAERRARSLVARLGDRLAAVGAALAGAERPGVLAVEWLDPPFVPGHWVPEQIGRAGGRCLTGEAGKASREVDWSALGELDPDALVIMPCGYGLNATRADADAHAHALARLAPRAISDGRAWIVDGSAYFNRSGPRAIRGVEILAALLHPDRFPTPPPTEAVPWQPPP